jgi:ABC-type sugar transport system permease subunit
MAVAGGTAAIPGRAGGAPILARASRGRPPGQAAQMRFVALALLPIGALFFVFAVLPVAMAIWLSFHRYNQLAPDIPFIGLRNFSFAFTEDPFFRNALGNTLKFAAVAVPLNIVIALPIALALNSVTRLKAVFRSAFFLPTISSAVAVGLIWRVIYDPQAGWLNAVLESVGLDGHSWLSQPATALWAVMVAALWQDLGYNILILLAGLQGIPDDFLDAAKVDGAGTLRRFFDVTLPLLRRTILFVVVLTAISYMQEFTHVSVMTNNGNPVRSSETLVVYIWKTGFGSLHMGYAASMAIILMLLVLGITLVQLRLLRTRWEY